MKAKFPIFSTLVQALEVCVAYKEKVRMMRVTSIQSGFADMGLRGKQNLRSRSAMASTLLIASGHSMPTLMEHVLI